MVKGLIFTDNAYFFCKRSQVQLTQVERFRVHRSGLKKPRQLVSKGLYIHIVIRHSSFFTRHSPFHLSDALLYALCPMLLALCPMLLALCPNRTYCPLLYFPLATLALCPLPYRSRNSHPRPSRNSQPASRNPQRSLKLHPRIHNRHADIRQNIADHE